MPAQKKSIKKSTRRVTRKPSEVTDSFWIEATRKKGEYPKHTDNGGKWLIFASIQLIDDIWETIKSATENGELGAAAKASTGLSNPNAQTQSNGVICVYTYDSNDEDDVRRIREALRRIGITRKIPYKADRDTLSGNYSNRGNKRISKYYE